MENGPNFQILELYQNRLKNEPARAEIRFFYYISDFAYEVKKCWGHPPMTFFLNKQNQIFSRFVMPVI